MICQKSRLRNGNNHKATYSVPWRMSTAASMTDEQTRTALPTDTAGSDASLESSVRFCWILELIRCLGINFEHVLEFLERGGIGLWTWTVSMNLERIERMVYCSIGHSFMNRLSRRNVLCNIRLLEQSSSPSSPPSSLLLLFSILLPKENFLLVYVLILIIATRSSFVEIRESEFKQCEQNLH